VAESYRVIISEDPVRLKGGINFYSYVGNNPMNSIDPFGLKEKNCSSEPPPPCDQCSVWCACEGSTCVCHLNTTAKIGL
jgi:hypothetical protein